jgi:chitinase
VSAASTSDYVPAIGTATFAPGTTSTKITVPVRADLADEPNERFAVRLSLGTPAVVKIYDDQGIATIVDDDAAHLIRAGATTVANGVLSVHASEYRWGRLSYRDSSVSFSSSRITAATFNDVTRSARFDGTGTNKGRSVSYTLDVTDRGAGTLDSFVLTLSDGTRVAGVLLKSGDIAYLT